MKLNIVFILIRTNIICDKIKKQHVTFYKVHRKVKLKYSFMYILYHILSSTFI